MHDYIKYWKYSIRRVFLPLDFSNWQREHSSRRSFLLSLSFSTLFLSLFLVLFLPLPPSLSLFIFSIGFREYNSNCNVVMICVCVSSSFSLAATVLNSIHHAYIFSYVADVGRLFLVIVIAVVVFFFAESVTYACGLYLKSRIPHKSLAYMSKQHTKAIFHKSGI